MQLKQYSGSDLDGILLLQREGEAGVLLTEGPRRSTFQRWIVITSRLFRRLLLTCGCDLNSSN